MVLRLDDYVPTLCMRPAELNGLEFLPTASKNRINPVFLLSPWSSARALDSAIERIERAFPNRSYFLDIDRNYSPSPGDRPAQQQYMELLDPDEGYANWWDFWTNHENIVPCVQIFDTDPASFRNQVENIQAQDREFCLRIELERIPRNLSGLIDQLEDIGTADYSVILEGGWTDDPLSLSARFAGLINGVLERLDGRIPVAVSCTSAPKAYSIFEGVTEFPFSNRALLSNVRRNVQRETIVYGDWASTKPREQGFGRTPLPRIDYPINSAWVISRSKEEEWGFEEAAEQLIQSDYWDGTLGIWGEQMIVDTAADEELGINSPQKNVSARVNIHLHRQALYGRDLGGLNLEEEWED